MTDRDPKPGKWILIARGQPADTAERTRPHLPVNVPAKNGALLVRCIDMEVRNVVDGIGDVYACLEYLNGYSPTAERVTIANPAAPDAPAVELQGLERFWMAGAAQGKAIGVDIAARPRAPTRAEKNAAKRARRERARGQRLK